MTIHRTRLLVFLAATLLAVCASGCASNDPATPAAGSPAGSGPSSAAVSPSPGSTSASGSGRTAPTTGDAAKLEGTTFVAKEVTGTYTIVPGSTISLTLQDGNLSAKAGCNDLFAQYTLDGDVLSATLGTTMMACDQPLMDQDTWLTAFLESAPTWTYDGGTLTLTNGTDTVVFSPDSAGAQALESTGWGLRGLITETDDARRFRSTSADAWIRFSGTQVSFDTSCNSGGGEVEIDDATITFGVLTQTMIACDGTEGEVEAAMTAVLQGITPYAVDDDPAGSTLTIMSADGTSGLRFAADPSVGADDLTSGSAAATATPTG
ncbi:MAG: META domain-containing protein [Nakamurella sp.]